MTELQKQAVVGSLLRKGVGFTNKGLGAAEKALQPVLQSKPVRIGGAAMKARGRVMTGKAKGEDVAGVLRKAQRTAAPPTGVRDVIPQGGMTALAALNMMKEAAGETNPAQEFKRGLGRGAGLALAGAVVAPLAGMAVGHAARGVGGMFERSRRNKLFQEIARRDQQIARDPRAREYFDLVMTYAPSLGRHPTAIADFLKKQLMYPVSSTEFLHALANFESTVKQNIDRGPAAHIGLAFEEGVKGHAGDILAQRRKMEEAKFKHGLTQGDS